MGLVGKLSMRLTQNRQKIQPSKSNRSNTSIEDVDSLVRSDPPREMFPHLNHSLLNKYRMNFPISEEEAQLLSTQGVIQ